MNKILEGTYKGIDIYSEENWWTFEIGKNRFGSEMDGSFTFKDIEGMLKNARNTINNEIVNRRYKYEKNPE